MEKKNILRQKFPLVVSSIKTNGISSVRSQQEVLKEKII